jgi:hypothetical protein
MLVYFLVYLLRFGGLEGNWPESTGQRLAVGQIAMQARRFSPMPETTADDAAGMKATGLRLGNRYKHSGSILSPNGTLPVAELKSTTWVPVKQKRIWLAKADTLYAIKAGQVFPVGLSHRELMKP